LLIAIDGTQWTWNDNLYAVEMRRSFINQLVAEGTEAQKKYLRGPTISGIQDPIIVDYALNVIHMWHRSGDERVVIAGYSRGGAVAIRIAQRLQRETWARNVRVACMALFDAVDRDCTMDATQIPGNVMYAIHAMRDPSVRSRWYFGNCGQTIAYPGRLVRRYFRATHGGLGGLPWAGDHPTAHHLVADAGVHRRWDTPHATVCELPTISNPEDVAGSAAVKKWVWSWLRKHDVVG